MSRPGQRQDLGLGAPLRQEAAERPAPLVQVLDLGGVRAGVVVRRQVGVLLELRVGDRDVQAVAEVLQVVERQLLHLVRGVAALEVRARACSP